MREPFSPEPINTLKSEHLDDGVRPIMACVGTAEEYGSEISDFTELKRRAVDVDYYADSEKLASQNHWNAGERTYIISGIDNKPKFTEKLYDCTSVVAVGRDIESNQEISFLTHQDPYSFLRVTRLDFIGDLKKRLVEMKSVCQPSTVDIVIIGGRISDTDDYQKSINLLNTLVTDAFGFSPVVITGPKDNGSEDIYFDTEHRKLFVIRPVSLLSNNSYVAENSETNVKRWKREIISEE